MSTSRRRSRPESNPQRIVLAAERRSPEVLLVTAQYALYDALVSINVPAEKARAVLESLEQDMSTILATKSDLGAVRAAAFLDDHPPGLDADRGDGPAVRGAEAHLRRGVPSG
jgi:hypothetical protein